jgi:all-trans-retinol 13,14-reductase
MKSKFKLIKKNSLAPHTYYFVFYSDLEIQFKPGQYFLLETQEGTHRAYSIANCFKKEDFLLKDLPEISTGTYISFIVSTRPNGPSSHFFEEVQEDIEVEAIGPNGRFNLVQNDRPKVFIATGTGVAPFIPMVYQSLADNPLQSVSVFFGLSFNEDKYIKRFFAEIINNKEEYPNFKFYLTSRHSQVTDLDLQGRVTESVPQTLVRPEESDFYICGNPEMVDDMKLALVQIGVFENKIFTEKYGKSKPKNK